MQFFYELQQLIIFLNRHLLDIEKETGIEGQVKYVLFGDEKSWYVVFVYKICFLTTFIFYTQYRRVQCVPLNDTGFQNRLSLPAEWRGLRDSELSTLSGIPSCIFVHASGFIGGNATREGAIEMAKKSLALAAASQKKE